jgi:non-ribosomal peptide synthetase component F/acyl carrier protein
MPQAFVFIDGMPLLPNGKLDRRGLPAPEHQGVRLDGNYQGARTPVEEVVAGMWMDVLKVSRVGINDNFFESGGHSLLATQLISRVREVFKVEVPLRQVFESPTVAEFAQGVEAALNLGDGLDIPQIAPASREQNLPLSFAQQRLWFIDQLEPGNSVYNSPAPVRLIGDLNVRALEQTLSEIVNRHESLRTTFALAGGQPIQVINVPEPITLPIVDLTSSHESEREAEAVQMAREEAKLPFDLSKGPLLRVRLLKLSEKDHILLFTMHHIVSDRWSAGVLIKEVAALYKAFCREEPSPLPELAIQYADFAVWQRDWLTENVLESQLSYWKQCLAGAPTVLELPTDRPRTPAQISPEANQPVAISKEMNEALKALSRQQGVTLFMTMLSAFSALLQRYSHQDDITVGTPIAGRNRSETEGLIGFFVNTLVLRNDLSGDPTFSELLQRVREVTLGAYSHQDLPFERLVEEFQPERALGHHPMFQVMFALQNAPQEALELPGLSLSLMEVEGRATVFDLTLILEDTPQGLAGSVRYNSDIFDASTIKRMMGHFENLLRSIAADAGQKLSDLPLVTREERRQLLTAWNKPEAKYSQSLCLHELFEAQVARAPNAVAATDENQRLSYAELNARANQLAHYLQAIGVGPESLVAICAQRSLEMIVGLLGILKAGGAYLPLDPVYPKERLAFILEDAQAKVLLTQQSLVDSLPDHSASIVFLDTDWDVIAQESDQNTASNATSENLAYVIYTSGSTGQPKGSLIQHSNVTRLFGSTESWFGFNESDVWTFFHSYAFDFSVWELWGALVYGGRLVIVDYWVSRSPEAFYELLVAEEVSVLNQTPSAFRQLMQVDERAGERDLKLRYVERRSIMQASGDGTGGTQKPARSWSICTGLPRQLST